MTTATTAFNIIKTRLEANIPNDSRGTPVFFRWQNEDEDSLGRKALPDIESPFIYTEFLTDPATLVSFGGGHGQNRYRHPARIDCYIFVPRGWGLAEAMTIAETVAGLFRSYRDTDISCFEATVYPGGSGSDLKPPGLDSEVDNYFYASVECSMFFDLIG